MRDPWIHNLRLLESQRRISEALERISAPFDWLRATEDAMRRLTSPLDRTQRSAAMIEKVAAPVHLAKKLAESFGSSNDRFDQFRRTEEAVATASRFDFGPCRRIAEEIERIGKSHAWIQPAISAVNRLVRPDCSQHIADLMARVAASFENCRKVEQALMGGALREVLFARIAPTIPGGSNASALTEINDAMRVLEEHAPERDGPAEEVNALSVSVDELANDVDSCVASTANESLAGILHRILAAVKQIPDTASQRLIWLVLVQMTVAILSGIIVAGIEEPIKKLLASQARQDAKDAVRAAAGSEFPELLASLAVAQKPLDLRLTARVHSGRLAALEPGDVVTVLWKGRHWSLVERIDRYSSKAVRGWVFSRYLLSLRK